MGLLDIFRRKNRGKKSVTRNQERHVEKEDYTPTEITFEYLLEKSNGGIASFQTDLSNCYFYGLLDTPINIEQGLYWLRKAVKGGDPMGIHNLATMYREGLYVRKDLKIAIKLFEQSGKLGLARSYNDLGVIKGGLGDYESAAEYYKKASEIDAEDGLSLSNLGSLLIQGKISGGIEKGIDCYKEAYQRKSIQGALQYAKCLYQQKRLKECAEVLVSFPELKESNKENISTEIGNRINSQIFWLCTRIHMLSVLERKYGNLELGNLCYEAARINHTPSALYEYLLNMDSDDMLYAEIFDEVSSHIKMPFLSYVKSKICRWSFYDIKETTKDACAHEADEICNLGILYFFGKKDYYGNKGSLTEAAELFKEAAALGYGAARYWLAVCNEEGLGLEKDINIAISLYLQILEDKNVDQRWGGSFSNNNHNLMIIDAAYRLGTLLINEGKNLKYGIHLLFDLMVNYNHHYSALELCKYSFKYNYSLPGTDFDKNTIVHNLKVLSSNGIGLGSKYLGEIYENDKDFTSAINYYITAFTQGQLDVVDNLNKLDFWNKQPNIMD